MYVHDDCGGGTLFQMMYIQTTLAQGTLHKNESESVWYWVEWAGALEKRKYFLDSF